MQSVQNTQRWKRLRDDGYNWGYPPANSKLMGHLRSYYPDWQASNFRAGTTNKCFSRNNVVIFFLFFSLAIFFPHYNKLLYLFIYFTFSAIQDMPDSSFALLPRLKFCLSLSLFMRALVCALLAISLSTALIQKERDPSLQWTTV